MDSAPYIDWAVADSVGRTLIPPGPRLPRAAMDEVVAELHRAAAAASEHVHRASGLPGRAQSDVRVVDRASWLSGNVAMASAMLAEAAGTAAEPSLLERVGGRLLGAQAGAVFAFIGTRILGQFDPFGQPPRLMLVAPNIVTIERQLGLDPAQFRLWVCLHEETHRFQFGAAPWLRGHLLELMRDVLATDSPSFASWRPSGRTLGIADLVTTPTQRAAFEQITATMSVMEGHADVVMDRAAEGVLPSLHTLRSVFEQRRDAPGLVRVISRVLGLDLKREQYREGAAFCRAVIAEVGVEGLNQVFESHGLLPSLTELRDPAQWLHRMAR